MHTGGLKGSQPPHCHLHKEIGSGYQADVYVLKSAAP
jgi:hypothetical protein